MTWSSLETDELSTVPTSTICDLTVDFAGIDWPFLQSVYGWAALQYQAWTRGRLVVESESSRKIVLQMNHVLEFWIDDRSYFGGDFYAFRKAPLVLDLSPGEHKIGNSFPASCIPSHYSCVTNFSSQEQKSDSMAPPCMPIYIELGPCPAQVTRVWDNPMTCSRT